ncbi:MAG: hypothetical protein C9356_07325 [Oleiphilus sp.]|nr:MAG: hypothetical protein C9356_07325 [Oleiphilus sp.]
MKLLFLNGWSMPDGIWHDVLCHLQGFESVKVQGVTRNWDLSEWMQCLDKQVTRDTVLMGWSLGGMLAMHYAATCARQFSGLISLMANPVFVRREDWASGMETKMFEQFSAELANGTGQDWLRTFSFLLTQGMASQRRLLRDLGRVYHKQSVPEHQVLCSSLAMLGQMDSRAELAAIDVPSAFIYGACDRLVPFEPGLNGLLPEQAEVHILSELGHCPFLDEQHAYTLCTVLNQQVDRFCQMQ